MGRIYLVRHGQASLLDDDYDRLSPLGHAQARRVGAWLGARAPAPAIAVCGGLRRQAQTLQGCMTAAGWTGVAATQDARFDEYEHHDLFGLAFPQFADHAAMGRHLRTVAHPRRDFHAMFEVALAAWLRADARDDGGLTWEAFRARCMVALTQVAAACGPGECAVICTSGGVISAIGQSLLGLPAQQVPLLHAPLFNASITTLLTRPGQVSLSTFNSVAHLEQDPGEALVSYR